MKKIEALKGGITLRALLLSAILIPLNCYWLIELEMVCYTTPTWVVPFSNVLFFYSCPHSIKHWVEKHSFENGTEAK